MTPEQLLEKLLFFKSLHWSWYSRTEKNVHFVHFACTQLQQHSNAAMLSSFRQWTNLAQLHHTGGGEVAPLAALQPPKPPLLLMFGQHQDDVTWRQLQLVGPVRPVAVHRHHLMDRGRVTASPHFFFLLNIQMHYYNKGKYSLWHLFILLHWSKLLSLFSTVLRT